MAAATSLSLRLGLHSVPSLVSANWIALSMNLHSRLVGGSALRLPVSAVSVLARSQRAFASFTWPARTASANSGDSLITMPASRTLREETPNSFAAWSTARCLRFGFAPEASAVPTGGDSDSLAPTLAAELSLDLGRFRPPALPPLRALLRLDCATASFAHSAASMARRSSLRCRRWIAAR